MTVGHWKERIRILNKAGSQTQSTIILLLYLWGRTAFISNRASTKWNPILLSPFPSGAVSLMDLMCSNILHPNLLPRRDAPLLLGARYLGAGFLLGVGPPGFIPGAVLTALEALPLFLNWRAPMPQMKCLRL
jgi:hypothetical protein